MSTLSSERGVTTLTFGMADGTQVEVTAYDGLPNVRISVGTGRAQTDVRFDTGNPGVAAKLAQLFAESARSRGYTEPLTF